MYGALIGAGAGMVGAGLGAYGAQKQKKAMSAANRRYQGQLQGYYAQDKVMNEDLQKQYQGVSDARLDKIGGALQDYMKTPYGQTGADTATSTAALAQVGAGANEGAGMGGAGVAWGAREGERTAAASGRQQMLAGGANQLQRQSGGQSQAVSDFATADLGFGRQVGNISRMEQYRRAMMERQLQEINANAQGAFDQASRSGQDWKTAGALVSSLGGAGGGMMDSFGGGAKSAGGGAPANPNWGPAGQQVGGGYYGGITPQAQNWGPGASQVGGGYYGSLFR